MWPLLSKERCIHDHLHSEYKQVTLCPHAQDNLQNQLLKSEMIHVPYLFYSANTHYKIKDPYLSSLTVILASWYLRLMFKTKYFWIYVFHIVWPEDSLKSVRLYIITRAHATIDYTRNTSEGIFFFLRRIAGSHSEEGTLRGRSLVPCFKNVMTWRLETPPELLFTNFRGKTLHSSHALSVVWDLPLT